MAASGSAGNFQSIPALKPEQVPIPTTAGSVNMYMNLNDSLNIWTVDFFKVHRPIAGGSGLLTYKVSLTSAQIKTLNSVPVLAVPSPGVGKAIEQISGDVRYTFGGIAFTSFVPILKIDTTPSYQSQAIGDIFNQVVNRWEQMINTGGGGLTQYAENKGLVITADSDSAMGNGSAIMYGCYRIITL